MMWGPRIGIEYPRQIRVPANQNAKFAKLIAANEPPLFCLTYEIIRHKELAKLKQK